MSLGEDSEKQETIFVSYDQVRSEGHVFYDELDRMLRKYGFDAFAQGLCRPFYDAVKGRRSIRPGVYFRCLRESELFQRYPSDLTMDSMLDKAERYLGERHDYFLYLLNGGKARTAPMRATSSHRSQVPGRGCSPAVPTRPGHDQTVVMMVRCPSGSPTTLMPWARRGSRTFMT